MTRIELLWWDGCPSYPAARSDLEAALRDLGADIAVELREVASDLDAERERFAGSPTIRVEGRDLFPPGDDDPIGLSCRVYRLRDGRVSPTPDPDDLRDALRGLVTERT